MSSVNTKVIPGLNPISRHTLKNVMSNNDKKQGNVLNKISEISKTPGHYSSQNIQMCSKDMYNNVENDLTKMNSKFDVKVNGDGIYNRTIQSQQSLRRRSEDLSNIKIKPPTNIGINNYNSNTILITNSYSQNNVTTNKNSIRITNSVNNPVPVNQSNSTINININNHYLDSNNDVSGNSGSLGLKNVPGRREQDCLAVPDSTTQLVKEPPVSFSNGEDVLVQHKDGRYYLGTVVAVDLPRDQCLIKFGDNTERWSNLKELTRLSTAESDNSPLCVICKTSGHKECDKIVSCDKCGRGYHQLCHTPKVSDKSMESSWHCKRCVEQMHYRQKSENKLIRKDAVRKSCSTVGIVNNIINEDKGKLPYNMSGLNWDTYHRVNIEQTYCYCGTSGKWHTQMLQCARCKQWFHDKCIKCLQYPLYCGDRFYIFVCSLCNYGSEFIRRLELKWVDLVHLLLFNLTTFNAKKYYDLDAVIIPYINDNWDALQLPLSIQNLSQSERRVEILQVLTKHQDRFKCGREIKKRVSMWGLRSRLPPPATSVSVPTTLGVVTEEALRELYRENKRLQFVSTSNCVQQNKQIIKAQGLNKSAFSSQKNQNQQVQLKGSYSHSSSTIVHPDTMLELMMGKAYNQENNSENESICSAVDSADELDKDIKMDIEIGETYVNDIHKKELKLYEMDYNGGGFVKKSVPFPKMSSAKRKMLLNNRTSETVKQVIQTNEPIIIDLDDDEDEYKCTTDIVTDTILPSGKHMKVEAPLTPPTSVSDPPTPPTNSLIGSSSNDTNDYNIDKSSLNSSKVNDFRLKFEVQDCETKDSDVQNIKTVFDNLKSEFKNDACDSSDETSSRGTLDLIIPPPKDFQGRNNPFHNLPKATKGGKNKSKVTPKGKQKKQETPPANNNNKTNNETTNRGAVVRTLKRQLSEKDITVGPNGEVKRRRMRRTRNSKDGLNQSPTLVGATASKSATFLPVRTDGKEWTQRSLRSSLNNSQTQPVPSTSQISNCVDYALNGRRLRQRQEVRYSDTVRRNITNTETVTVTVIPPSPSKQKEPDVCMTDLKSSVNLYFGATNRILNGEKFSVQGKRIGPNGKVQYLIEWHSPS